MEERVHSEGEGGVQRSEKKAFRGLDDEEKVAFREGERGVQSAWTEAMVARVQRRRHLEKVKEAVRELGPRK